MNASKWTNAMLVQTERISFCTPIVKLGPTVREPGPINRQTAEKPCHVSTSGRIFRIIYMLFFDFHNLLTFVSYLYVL